MKGQALFAFWKYDSFPFVLGAEIVEMHADGSVSTNGYTGMRFKPIKILPFAVGAMIHQNLKTLESQHRKAKAEFDKEWRKHVTELLPEAGE